MHLFLAEDEATMVELIPAYLGALAMCYNKMRMKISGIYMNAPILLSVEISTPIVTPFQSR
jgi:hypothetical protein